MAKSNLARAIQEKTTEKPVPGFFNDDENIVTDENGLEAEGKSEDIEGTGSDDVDKIVEAIETQTIESRQPEKIIGKVPLTLLKRIQAMIKESQNPQLITTYDVLEGFYVADRVAELTPASETGWTDGKIAPSFRGIYTTLRDKVEGQEFWCEVGWFTGEGYAQKIAPPDGWK